VTLFITEALGPSIVIKSGPETPVGMRKEAFENEPYVAIGTQISTERCYNDMCVTSKYVK
jgi:hypothetical protein